MTSLHDKQMIETNSESAILSHQSYKPDVYAVCHHSGRYLLRDETNPRPLAFLREQHDFPGLPKLDRSFSRAAHSYQHQHLSWSRVAIQALALLLSGGLVLALVLAASRYGDFVAAGLLQTAFTVFLVVLGLVGAALLLWGIYLASRRDVIYHTHAAQRGLGPATGDYPLDVRYEIDAREELTVGLGNRLGKAPDTPQQACRLSVTAYPVENDLESFAMYRRQYSSLPVGDYVHAGVLGLEGTQDVVFSGDAVEFGHRVVLRKPSQEIGAAESGQGFQPFTVDAPYTIRRSALCPVEAGQEHFLIECLPSLSAHDSRTLFLRFKWRGVGAAPKIVLKECALRAPSEQKVIRVDFGREDPDRERVLWRNLAFQEGALQLAVSFKEPVLNFQEPLDGTYEVELDGLVSGLRIHPDHLWTVWGLRAESGASLIRRKAVIKGDLALDPRRLSQEHEYVRTVAVACGLPPDHRLVERVVAQLSAEGVDILRVAQAAPRLNPAGRLDTRLNYWDIAGRRCDPHSAEAVDVHVVISGHEPVTLARVVVNPDAATKIDLRLRCLHDPRCPEISQAVNAWVDKTDDFGCDLAMRIQQAIDAPFEPSMQAGEGR